MNTKAKLLLTTAAIAVALSNTARAADAPASSASEEIIVITTGSQVKLPESFAGGQVARGGRVGLFGNLDMMDTPFASTSYTAKLMQDQQAKSVADVLQNDPVVRVAKGFGNFQELYVIRGFPVYSDDMTYNGLYGILPRQYVAAEFLERVEVFRGANSFLNGASPGGSGIGGAFNLVPKRAPNDPLTRATIGYENNGQIYGALDVARRFGNNDEIGVRVNLVRRDGETSVEDQDRELTVASLGTDYNGEQFRLSADIGYQDHRIDQPRPSVTPFGAIPAPPEASKNFAQPWTYTDERQFFGVMRGEYDFTDHTTVWAAGGLRIGKEANVLSNPSSAMDGTTSSYRFDNARKDNVYSGEVGARTEFTTGPVGHRLTVSAGIISLNSKNAYAFSSFFTPYANNLYAPTAVPAPVPNFFVGGVLSNPLTTERTENKSLAIADMLAFFDETVLLTVGLRYQNIDTKTFDYNTGAPLSGYDQSRLTPAVGLVYKPTPEVSLYGNFTQGLIPGEVAPATSGGSPVTNVGQVFKPYQADQLEIGVKYDGGKIGGTVSAFTLARPTSRVDGGVFRVSGEQRNRGIEASAFGQITDELRLIAGATFLDAKMTRTQSGLFDGKRAVGVPKTQLNLNAEWDVAAVPGLTFDGRAVYTSSQFSDSANTFRVKSWYRFDLGARYKTEIASKEVTLRARVDNVTDNNYWASVGGFPGSNYLVLSTPRTVVISASVDF